MKTDSVAYLSDAIRRIEGGNVSSSSGSHMAGIFGKAAKAFEKEFRGYVSRTLKTCGLDYDTNIRAMIKGTAFQKLTLGNLMAVIKKASTLNSQCVSACVPDGCELSGFLDTVKQINDAWVQVKHGDEVEAPILITRMKSMLELLQLIRTQQE